MPFDPETAEQLPDDPLEAAQKLCADFERFSVPHKALADQGVGKYDEYLNALALLEALAEINHVDLPVRPLPADKKQAVRQVVALFREIITRDRDHF